MADGNSNIYSALEESLLELKRLGWEYNTFAALNRVTYRG